MSAIEWVGLLVFAGLLLYLLVAFLKPEWYG